MSMSLSAMRSLVLAVLGAACLAGCNDLPAPHVVDNAADFARVAELLKAPPLRPVPEAMAELRPPYPCGEHLFMAMQFAADAGAVYFAGTENYGVLDIGTGEIVASGAGVPHGQISRNGRVLAVPVDGGVELRNTETGEVLVTLPGASGDEFSWVGDSGIAHVVPYSGSFADPRIVYIDLATGLESSLATVDVRPSRYIFDFGVLMNPGGQSGYLHARERFHEMKLTPGPDGVRAELGASRPIDTINPVRAIALSEDHGVLFEDEAVIIFEIATFESARVDLPGLSPASWTRTSDPDRLLVSGYFKDENQEPLKRDGKAVLRDFYYSQSRRSLAPVQLDVDVSDLTYVPSVRSHLLRGKHSFRPYVLPAGGEEGEPAEVIAAARADVLASIEKAR